MSNRFKKNKNLFADWLTYEERAGIVRMCFLHEEISVYICMWDSALSHCLLRLVFMIMVIIINVYGST